MVKAGRHGPPGDVSGDAAAGESGCIQVPRRLAASAIRQAKPEVSGTEMLLGVLGMA
jgi:hypothetical protein